MAYPLFFGFDRFFHFLTAKIKKEETNPMRNLKKFLALVLAMMMVFSLMITVNAAKLDDFTDSESVNPKYAEAVDVLTQLGIFKGQGNKTWPPKRS